MKKITTYLKNTSNTHIVGKLAMFNRSTLYSFVIGISFYTTFGFGNIFDWGSSFLTSLYPSPEKKELKSNYDERSEEILFSTYTISLSDFPAELNSFSMGSLKSSNSFLPIPKTGVLDQFTTIVYSENNSIKEHAAANVTNEESDRSDIFHSENNSTINADWITPGAASVGVLNNANSVTFSHTTGAGADRLLMVGVSAIQPGHQVTSLTYNGVALTRLGIYTHPSQTRVEIWYLIAPPVGSYNIVLNNSVNENAVIGAQSFNDVNQTIPFGTPTSATGISTNASANISSATGEIVYGVVGYNNGDTNLSPGVGQTEYWDQTMNSTIAGAGSTKAGATTVSMSWSSTGQSWTIAGVALKSAFVPEICNNGIDDDGDGLIDCFDCEDCYAASGCGDNDGDGIGDYCDLDDDNDGIPDLDECPQIVSSGLSGAITGFSYDISSTNPADQTVAHMLNSITVGGTTYNDFIVPDNYSSFFTTITDNNGVRFTENGITNVFDFSNPNYDQDILQAFQSRNLNAYQSLDYNNFSDGDYFELYYNSPIISTSGGFLAVTERLGNNPQVVEALDINGNIIGTTLNVSNSEYIDLGHDVHFDGTPQTVRMALYSLEDIAALGTMIYGLRISFGSSATIDGPDAKVFIFGNSSLVSCDCDDDGKPNYLDLDSDNDGILDVNEAGHSANDANNDGLIDGVAADFGTNGLFDALETSADNGVLNYTISDSETTPDGTYDICELDSDADGCFDTQEESISDTDSDGIAGTGVPIVDASGRVTAITYAAPANNYWQNPSIGPCLAEICNDGIDNDGDGLTDCEDDDCYLAANSGDTDNDGDGIGDGCDLDDDNDGILDTDECDGTFALDGTHTASTYTTTQFSSTASGIQYDINLINGITFNTSTGPNLSNFNGGPPSPYNGSQTHLWLEINTDRTIGDHGTFTITFPDYVINPTINFGGLSANTTSPDWSLTLINQTVGVDMNLLYTDGDFELVGDTILARENPSTNGSGLVEFTGRVQQLQFQLGHYTESNLDGPVRFATNVGYTLCADTDVDSDGIASFFDLDSDGDGCYDKIEAGVTGFTTNGTITDSLAANSAGEVGANGLDDDIESDDTPAATTSGSYTIIQTNAGTDDFQDAGVNNCVEICNNGIDDDGDGDTDCADSDCSSIVTLSLPDIEECVNSTTLALSGGSPAGGTYSGAGVSGTNFDASVAGAGTHTITYSYTNTSGCINTATEDITVYALPSVSLTLTDTEECENSTILSLSGGSPAGGTYSGTGVSGTNFDASTAGVGVHTITYTYTDGNGCSNFTVDSITVFALPTVSLTLPDSEECENNTVLALGGGSPSGGTYSGTGVSGGNFNALVAGLGTHTITYTYTDVNGCSNTATDDIDVIALPTVSLNLSNDNDCVSDNTLLLSGGSPAGGSYSGPGVTGTNFDASVVGSGVHTITYTYTDGNGCSNSATDNIAVFALPSVNLTLADTEDCVLNSTLALSGGTPLGGTYSGTGVSGTNFDASAAGLGTHTITYTFTDGNGCINFATQDITVVSDPTVTLTLTTDEDCVSNNTLALSGGIPLGGTYSGTGVSSANFNAAAAGAGSHNVFYTYTDANGCSNTAIDVITVYTAPSITLITPTDPTTCGGADGAITITATGGSGSFEYRLISGSWQSSNVFNSLSAGNHTVEIRNDNGTCETAYGANPFVLTDPTGFTADIILPAFECVGTAADFEAVNVGGGPSPYSWDFGSGATPATATGRGPHSVVYSSVGNKTVTLTVTRFGCTDVDVETYTVYDLPTVSLSLSDTEECITSNTLTLSGGSPSGGTYSGTGVSGTNFNASTAGLGIHVVTYTYTDANGCTNTATDNIEVFNLPLVNLTLGTDEECISSNTLALSGGSPSGGTYSGTGVIGTNFNPSTAGVGTHVITYTYTDGNGCVNTATDNITVHDFPTINLVNSSDPTTCGGTEGSITISASGATGIFEYRLDSGSWQSSNTFSGLAAGSYNVFVRNSNDFCEIAYPSNPVVLSDPPATIVTTTVISDYTGEDISCVGSSDGFATASGSGGASPYSYIWSNGQTGDTLRNVTAGTYTVTATDALGCQGTQSVSLNDPPPLGVSAIFTDVSCYGGFDGAIDVTAIGGVGAYTYSWDDFNAEAFWPFDGTTDDISGNGHNATAFYGLESYSTDAVDGGQSFDFNGSTRIRYDDDVSFMESPFNFRSVLMWIKPVNLSGRQMLIESGGPTHGFALRLNGNKLQGAVRSFSSQRSAFEMTFPNDGAWHQVGFIYTNGNFRLIIDGVLGPDYNTGFTTIQMNAPPLNSGAIAGKQGGDAFGNSSSSSNYYYEGLMDNVSFHDYAMTSEQVSDYFTDDGDRSGLPAGDYTVYVYDLNGCTDSITLTLNQPDSLALTANITDVLCNGGNSGAVDLIIAGGVGPFTQSWSTGATTEDISSLVIGTYTVTVTDDNGCTVEDSFVVNEPEELTASAAVTSNFNTYNISCNGATDGTATATPAGGMAPFSYSWDNGQTTATATSLGAGTYNITVTDDNGCTTTTSVSLTAPPQITVSTAVTSSYGGEDISCVGASDGSASASASNGVGTYSYAWSDGQIGNSLNNVLAGTYTVTATDDNGCTATATVTLQDPSPITIVTSVTSDYNGADISCAGETDGSAAATASGGGGAPYTYAWNNGQSGSNLINVGAGTYTVTATDAFGCTNTETISLSNPSGLSVDIDITSDYNGNSLSCNGGMDGTATATGNGGTGAYTYAWSDGQTGEDLINATATTYTVTVTDTNGCTATESTTFDQPSPLTFSVTSADPSDCGVNDGIILIAASGGIGTYEYSLDGATWQPISVFTGLSPGTYFTYVRNGIGTCVNGPNAVTINIPEAPTIDNLTIINPTTGVSTDGGILVTASGNNSIAIEYSINGGTSWQSSNLFSGLTVGSYTLTVRYAGFVCESSSPFSLTAGGGIVGQGGGEDYCSDDLSGQQFVEVYYIPYPEDQVFTSLSVLHTPFCGSPEVVEEPIQTYVSLGAVEAGTVIYYDHWEDGYEINLSFPIQSTTEIWGDGNISNGIPPGYTVDYLSAADIIILNNSVQTTTRQSVIDFDAGDKIGSLGNLAMTRLAWASGLNTLLAGALEVYPTLDWGTEFQIPVGENADVNFMFEYTAVTIMASEDNTTVNIDTDANGSNDVTVNLDEGESYMVNGGVSAGASISATRPIQVDLITGDICARAESRFFTIKPTNQWSDSYYNPVATLNDGGTGANANNNPTYVHLYNPNPGNIQVRWETDAGYQGQVSVAGNSTNFIEVPDNTGSRFYTNNGREFYAIATIDSDGDTDATLRNSAHDWGFALVPESNVSNQITLVGFAPGQDPTACNTTSINKAGWSVHYVDSEESNSGSFPATNAFDDNDNTYWHTQYNPSNDPQPHDLQIDLGADYEVSGFRYQPRIGSTISNTISNNTFEAISTTTVETITSTINVPIGGLISDINVLNLDISHTYINDLRISLTSPSGTAVTLLNFPCGNDDDILIDMDDEGSAYNSWACPPTNSAAYQPFESLSAFDGEDPAGVWTLTIEDVFNDDGGGLNGWQLQVTTGTAGNGTIEDYEFFLSADGTNWTAGGASGTWANDPSEKEVSFTPTTARYVRLVSTSEIYGNPWTSVAELDVLECTPVSNENSAPVWLTAAYPSGSSSTGSINICVDYNGDGGSLTDANGETYDLNLVLNNLQNAKIYDPDGDQTGMQIWVCDGSDAVIAGAWGQDPATASGGIPAIDLGVGLPNGIPFATSKCVELSKDYNSNGLYDECDEVIYTLFIRNSGALPLSTGTVNVKDTLPSDLVYIDNSTVAIVNGAVNNLTDDTGPASPFPLDENGINYNTVIQPGDSVIFRFEAVIGDIASAKFITNQAYVTNGQKELLPEVSFPAQEPTGAILTGVPADTTLQCSTIPAAPIIGSDIYPTNNCEEVDVIPQAGWTLEYVDSEELVSETAPATNAFDGDNNTYWHTQYNGSAPSHPHEIQIDLGATYNVTGFRYLPRQASANGRIADYEFYVSDDPSAWGTAINTGTWTNTAAEQEEIISITRGRYVRLVATSEVGGNPYTSIAELNILQCVNFAPVTTTFSETSTQTSNGSATDDCYEITREWESTDHCGQVSNYSQVITVIDTIAPVFSGFPADVTVASNAIPEAPVLGCGSLSNLALGKPTTQSSVDFGGQSSRAVDGNTNGVYGGNSVTHTLAEAQPWWEVDLQSVYPIEEIEIWNRTDCCSGRLTNYYILVSDKAFESNDLSTNLINPEIKSYFESATAGSPTTISIDTTARFVRVQLQGTEVLSLAEVVVTPSCIIATDGCDPDVDITYSEVNIPSGCSYDITRTWEATDNCGNVTSQTQTITVSTTLYVTADVSSDFNSRDLSCNGANDGEASITIDGGVAPLSINWSNGQSGTTAINLNAGTYYVTVTDDNGCIAEDSVTLVAPPDILINANITSNHNGEDISCSGGNDGSVFANASGGTGVITYAWSSGQSTASATTLTAGTYTVTATDANGCTATSSVTLNDPTPLTVNASITSDFNGEDISCPTFNDGEATATSTGGTGTITYNWSNSFSGNVNTNLIAGEYIVTATDANGCFAIDSVTLVDPTLITFTISTQTNPLLCEGTDGLIEVSASGGMGTYQYRLGAAGTWQVSNTFTGLVAGTYDVYVRNSDGTCMVGPSSVTLDDPIPQSCPIFPALDTICNTDVNVSLSVTLSPDATGYTWTIPVGMNVLSGAGTNSIVLDMNEISTGSYDICVVTNSNCGDSPACCMTIELVECVEICNNGIDDDGDGNIDLADDECLSCDVVYNSDEEYLQLINATSGLAEDTLNASVLTNAGDAIGIDPVSQRFYFLEGGSTNPEISFINSNTGNQINTGVTIPAGSFVPAFGFNATGLGYAISESGGLYSITTNYGGTDIPTVNLLGNIGPASLGDLAVDNDGIIWAVLNGNELYRIDPIAAIPTSSLVGTVTEATNFGGNDIESVAFSGTGQLLVGADSNIYDVNIATTQGTLIGNLGAATHDFASCAFPVFSTDLAVSKTVAQVGPAAPGDTLDYTITVSNTGGIVITGASFTDTIPDGTSYISGSTALNGTSIADVAGEMPFVNGGSINSPSSASGIIITGVDVTITFRVVIDCCPGVATISNQGEVDYNGATAITLSDDPGVSGLTDPTDIAVSTLAAPVITMAASNQTIDCNTATNGTSLTQLVELQRRSFGDGFVRSSKLDE